LQADIELEITQASAVNIRIDSNFDICKIFPAGATYTKLVTEIKSRFEDKAIYFDRSNSPNSSMCRITLTSLARKQTIIGMITPVAKARFTWLVRKYYG
jgi:hypothetical protein